MTVPYQSRQDLIVFEGDSFELTLEIKDDQGQAIDISSYDFAARIGDRTNPNVITGTTLIVDGPAGELLVEFPGTDALVPNQQYEYQIRLDDKGDLVKTILTGHLTVRNSLFV